MERKSKLIGVFWLAALFFESMYNCGLAEKTSGKIAMQIGKTSALEKVLEYLYLGQIRVSMEEIDDVMEVADYLQSSDLKKICNDFLMLMPLNTKNCVQICLLSTLYDMPVQEHATKYMKGHLIQVLQGDDILTLTHEYVMSLFVDKTLSYVTHDTFLRFLVRWIKHDIENRCNNAAELFNALSIEHMSTGVLKEILEDDKLVEFFPATDINALLEKRKIKGVNEDHLGTREVILLGGGHYYDSCPEIPGISVDRLYAFNILEEKWSELCRLPRPIKQPLMRIDCHGKIYVIEKKPVALYGFSNYTLYVFEVLSKSWKIIKMDQDNTYTNLQLHDLIICKERVFLLGTLFQPFGKVGHCCYLFEVKEGGNLEAHILLDCNAADMFHGCPIDDNKIGIVHVCKWSNRTRVQIKHLLLDNMSLLQPCRAKSCASPLSFIRTFMNKDEIVQFDMQKKTILKYNTDDNRWSSFPRMAPPPMKLTSSSMYSFYNDELYVFCGERSKKAYKYQCRKRKWNMLEDVPAPTFLLNSATCVTTLPVDLLLCHQNCPHCYYVPKGSDVTYPDMWESEFSDKDSEICDSDEYDWDNDHDDEDVDDDRSSNCALM